MEKEEKISKVALRSKDFQVRDSIFTKLIGDTNFNAVRKFIVCVYVVYFLKNVMKDLYYGGRSQFGFMLIFEGFGKFHLVIGIWLFMFLVHSSLFVGLKLWGNGPRQFKAFNGLFLCLAGVCLFGTFHFVANLCFKYGLPIASRAVVLGEQTRFIMKGYAFLRSSAEMVMTKQAFPTAKHFFYYSFAPTIIYRDNYPRTATRSWMRILKLAMNIFCAIHFLSLIEYEHFLKEPLQNFGLKPFNYIDITYICLLNAVPGFISFWFMTQITVLYLVQNLFAELLRFGDREFFRDWWNCTDMNSFHIDWNVVVQDGLYEYVYKDFYLNVFPKNKAAARTAVFILSVALHEVLLTYTTELICPVFFTTLLMSVILMTFAINKKKFKMSLSGIVISLGFLYTIPHLEYFAKHNCPNSHYVRDSMFYMPRLFNCHKL